MNEAEQAAREAAAVGEAFGALVEEELNPLAEAVEATFERMSSTVTRELEQAARGGRLTMRSLVDDVLRDLNRLGAEALVRQPLENALQGLVQGAFGGARAGGGAALPGNAYLVGERGPEVFVPSTAGRVSQAGAQAVTVNVNVAGTAAQDFPRSRAQIAGAVARGLRQAARHG